MVLFNKQGHTLMITAFNNFMDISAAYTKRNGQMTASWGILGNAKSIPKDHMIWTMAFYSPNGVKKVSKIS